MLFDSSSNRLISMGFLKKPYFTNTTNGFKENVFKTLVAKNHFRPTTLFPYFCNTNVSSPELWSF